ncbi:hypothetical protein ACTWQB_03155 [Piscibacillus sp. B03]|uniref:hypothetical protein n=1 Tax=Piscibacillus sp. B03 TaxID=3457430 RepID=UPI003FCE7D9F
MSEGKVFCEECSRPIKDKDELVTTTVLFSLVPYCKDCYVDQIKGMSSLIVSNTPVNGTYSNFFSVIGLIALIPIMFISDSIKYIFIIGIIIFLLYRVFSYLWFERHLN